MAGVSLGSAWDRSDVHDIQQIGFMLKTVIEWKTRH